MKIFEKKHMYVIVTDFRTNIKVQNFAEEHSARKSQIEVMELPRELGEGAEIIFMSKEKKDDVLESLAEKFTNYNLFNEEDFIFMERKMEI